MDVSIHRAMRKVFAHTSAELSSDFLKNFDDASAPLSNGQLQEISQEAGVDLHEDDGIFSMTGDWNSMISAYKLLIELLNSVYGIPPVSSTLDYEHQNYGNCDSNKQTVSNTRVNNSGNKPTTKKKRKKRKPQAVPEGPRKNKIPDPIVLTFSSTDFMLQGPTEQEQLPADEAKKDLDPMYDGETEEEADVAPVNDTYHSSEEDDKDNIDLTPGMCNTENKDMDPGISYVHKKQQANRDLSNRSKDIKPDVDSGEITVMRTKTKQTLRVDNLAKKISKMSTPKKHKRKGVPVKLHKRNLRKEEREDSDAKSVEIKQEEGDDDGPQETVLVSDISEEDEGNDNVEEDEDEVEADEVVEEDKDEDDQEWLPDKDFNDSSEGLKVKFERKSGKRQTRQTRSGQIKKSRGKRTQAVTKHIDYPCPSCSYVAKKRSQLGEHYRRNHRMKKWKCEHCDRTFGIHKDLKRHILTHIEPQHCCDTCGKMYKSLRTFIKHKKVHEDNYEKPEYPCDQCDKRFSTKYVLNYHIKSEHMGIKKSFLCPTCGKSFTQKNSYIQHANVHMGLRPHVCKVCNKSFAYEKSLKEHKYTHDEVKRFKCDVCGKLFRQSSALAIHVKVHKGGKDHLCGVCGKGFTQKQALYRHERIHNGDKPFTCCFCARKFSDTSIIRRHMILVHKKDPKRWREGVISDLKGKEGYFIESFDGTIRRGGRPLMTGGPPESADKENDENDKTNEQVPTPPNAGTVTSEPLSSPESENRTAFVNNIVERIISDNAETGQTLDKMDNNSETVTSSSENVENFMSHQQQSQPLPPVTSVRPLSRPVDHVTATSHGLSPQDEQMAAATAEYLRKQALLQAVSTMHHQEQVQAHNQGQSQGHSSMHLPVLPYSIDPATAAGIDQVSHLPHQPATYLGGSGGSDGYTDLRRKDGREGTDHSYTDIQQVHDPSQRQYDNKNPGQWTVPPFPYLYMHQNYNPIQYQNQNQ